MMTPQALLMLLIWPVVTGVFFARMARDKALVVSILVGYLILPQLAAIELPFLPDFDKRLVLCYSALLFALVTRGKDTNAQPIEMPKLVLVLLVMYLIQPIPTALTNTDTLYDGPVVRNAITLFHGMAEIVEFFGHSIPFILGFSMLSTPRGARLIVMALVVGMLIYSLPMLVELRLSPQINIWVYGYFQHNFGQTIRYGGYRPIVFLPHPLWLAFITLMAVLGAFAIARVRREAKWYRISAFLMMMLVLCKTLGVLMHVAIGGVLIWFARPRIVLLAAAVVGIGAFSYPLLRMQPWMPVDDLVEAISGADAERGQSFGFRIDNETLLLERALERPIFGWGGESRQRVVDINSGRYATIIDGEWIGILGLSGFFGYIAEFGLMVLPVLMLLRAWPKGRGGPVTEEQMCIVALAMMLALNVLDMIPNATITPLTWMLAGTVAGSAVRLRQGRYFSSSVNQKVENLPKTTGLRPVI